MIKCGECRYNIFGNCSKLHITGINDNDYCSWAERIDKLQMNKCYHCKWWSYSFGCQSKYKCEHEPLKGVDNDL